MEKIRIYHNPKCSKSREALKIIAAKNIDVEIREYLKEPLSRTELEDLFRILSIRPKDCLRTKEIEWQVAGIDAEDDSRVVEFMVQQPKVLERPIVIYKEKGVVARPPEKLNELF